MKKCVFLLAIFIAFCGVFCSRCVQAQNALEKSLPLVEFDKPFLFTYGAWDKKVKVENGAAILRGVTNTGGGGYNVTLNLTPQSDWTPTVRVRLGASNQSGGLRVLVRDDQKGSAAFDFSFKDVPPGEWRVLMPREGASLTQPNELDNKQPLQLDKITQIQIGGDWAGNKPMDVEVNSIALLAPSAEMLAARAEKEKRLLAEAEKLRKEQAAQKAKYVGGTPLSPIVEHVSMVAPDVIAIEIQAGRVILSALTKYEAQTGDEKREKKNDKGEIESVILVRGGQEIGWLIGPQRDWLTPYEKYEGDPLLEFEADSAANYSVTSDADFGTQKPLLVSRKSKPNGWAQGIGVLSVRHTLYLKMPEPLATGKKYNIALGALNTKQNVAGFVFDAAKIRSEAVHVNQIGYRPDDPLKRAFVSCWLGNGGVLKLPQTLDFSLVDDKTSKEVFSGKGELHFPASKPELMQTDKNFNGTDVARLDFSSFKTPGRYRVCVANVGCSYPFEIGAEAWKKAFLVQMQGLYNQRSGMELGPPYTDFKKPRDMNPLDGYPVTKTIYRWVEKGGEAWAEIPAGDSGEKANGWGGYHDAGDWNPRRVSHMKVTMAQLEVFELFPNYFASLKLNIPETKGVPDILTEAIWEFECFHRLQNAEGGVGYGIESKGDPAAGEVSWLNSFPSYVFAPDYANSWYYAAVGAELSYVLQKYDAKLAATYRESATRAFAWAEKDYAAAKASGEFAKQYETWKSLDSRNLAALELYRLTREKPYHDIFLQDTVLKDDKPELFAWGKAWQNNHAFLYARLPADLGDENLKKKAAAGVRELAERALTYASNNAFNLTTPDKGKPQFIGFYSTPDATELTRAHYLTGEAKYLAGAVQATQFQSGCNPNNMVYTTGLGANPVQNAFKLDARRTGQKTPPGLTPYGNIDFAKWNNGGITWPITWYLGKITTPNPYAWPTAEAYWDLGGWPMLEEFTVDAWAPNVQVWGYLAARK